MYKNELFIIGGDYNVAPEDNDVYDPEKLAKSIGFHIDERKEFWDIINTTGAIDTYRLYNPTHKAYSWWDYRHSGWVRDHGMRIDQILVTPNVADKLKNADILKKYRSLPNASDHTPITVEISC